jgi:hypothetical protein
MSLRSLSLGALGVGSLLLSGLGLYLFLGWLGNIALVGTGVIALLLLLLGLVGVAGEELSKRVGG